MESCEKMGRKIHMYLKARSGSRLGKRERRLDMGIRGLRMEGVTVENKRLYYVSTANAQPLSKNVPTNVCLFVCLFLSSPPELARQNASSSQQPPRGYYRQDK